MNSTHRIREGTHCSISKPAAPLPSLMLHRRRVRASAMCPWVKKELAADSGANMGQPLGTLCSSPVIYLKHSVFCQEPHIVVSFCLLLDTWSHFFFLF